VADDRAPDAHARAGDRRRKLPRGRVVLAAELYLERLIQAFGEIDTIDLRPTIAGDMIVYEMIVPVSRALADDPAALLARETQPTRPSRRRHPGWSARWRSAT